MDAETLARMLRAVAAELERDPALADRIAVAVAVAPTHSGRGETEGGEHQRDQSDGRIGVGAEPAGARGAPSRADGRGSGVGAAGVNRSFRPRLVTGASPELGPGILDPFALFARRGEAGLRAALDELRLGGLRAILREHRLDPAGRLVGTNDAEKLRAAIVQAVVMGAQ